MKHYSQRAGAALFRPLQLSASTVEFQAVYASVTHPSIDTLNSSSALEPPERLQLRV
jgi:hypothetical protein